MKRMIDNKDYESLKKNVNDTKSMVDKGMYYTITAPTYDSENLNYILTPSAVLNTTTGINIKINDLILYIDENDKPKELYLVSAVSEFLTLSKVAEFGGGGDKKYIHNLYVQCYNTTVSKMSFQCMFSIINNSNAELTTRAEIESEIFRILGTNSNVARDMKHGAIVATGFVEGMGQYNIFGIVTGLNSTLTGESQVYYVFSNASSSINYGNFPNDTQYPTNVYTIKDIVEEL